jgi:hypothetical protein
VISKPLASRKLTKKVYKVVKKGTIEIVNYWSQSIKMKFEFSELISFVSLATKAKSLRRGVKEVVKAIRKGEKG